MNLKRKASLLFAACLLVLTGVFAFLTHREIRQERLDTALIPAIERNDVVETVSLIHQGANSNAQKRVISGRPLWRVMLDLARGKRLVGGDSALQVAIAVDLRNQPDILQPGPAASHAKMESSYTILKALAGAGALHSAHAGKAGKSVTDVEHLLKPVRARLPFDEDKYDRQQLQGALTKAILTSGGSAAACSGLADCWMKAGDYAAAAHWFRNALLWQPSDATAQVGLSRAKQYLRVKQSILDLLPSDCLVLQVRPYPGPVPGKTWAAVYNEKIKGLRLAVYEDRPGGFARISAAGNLDHDGLNGDDIDEVQLFVSDLTATGNPVIIVHNIFYGGSWAPSHMAIFAWRGARLVSILQADGSEPLEIADLNHNGRYQIVAEYEIGTTMCHAAQPRWTDIYSYKNGRFVNSNEDFPKQFKDYEHDLRTTLHDYPDDTDVKKHLAMVYKILGKRSSAHGLLH